MFGLFKSDPTKKLEKQYKKLMEEAHALSHKDRKAADQKMKEADDIAKQLEAMRK